MSTNSFTTPHIQTLEVLLPALYHDKFGAGSQRFHPLVLSIPAFHEILLVLPLPPFHEILLLALSNFIIL